MGNCCTKCVDRESAVGHDYNNENTPHISSNNLSSTAFSEDQTDRIQFNINSTDNLEEELNKLQKISSYQFVNRKNIPILDYNLSLSKTNECSNLRLSEPNYFDLSKNLEFIKGQCVGTGKIGSVYSGLSTDTGEIVAIKSVKLNKSLLIEKHIFDINEAVERLSQLQHKNIIKYMCTQPSENPHEIDIIFEFCNGGSVKQILDRFGAFDEKLIRLYVKQILEGLVYLHERNIVHRNIKNCNLLVDNNGTVKLSDFVVSNILIGDDPEAILYFNTNNGQEAPFWIAPEVVNHEKNLTWAVDIWSVGCTIIEMATKIPPWANITTDCSEVLALIANSNAPPKFPSHVSRNLKSFLTCCLQKDPTKRQSARKLLQHEFFQIPQINGLVKRNSQNVPDNKQLTEFRRNVIGMNSLKNSKSPDKIEDFKSNSISKTIQDNKLNKQPFKLIQNAKITIVEKEDEKVDENNQPLDKIKDVKNMLGKKEENNPFFSLSMTVCSEQTMMSHNQEMFIGNKILPADIEEVDEVDSPIVSKKRDSFKFDFNKIELYQVNDKDYTNYIAKENTEKMNKLLENSNDSGMIINQQSNRMFILQKLDSNSNNANSPRDNNLINMNVHNNVNHNDTINNSDIDQSCLSIKNFIDNVKLIDLLDVDNSDKLATMEFSKEEYQKLDLFFKENNKGSIAPIELDHIQHYIKLMK